MLEQLLSTIEPGCVRLILVDDPSRVFDEMEVTRADSLSRDCKASQTVGCIWHSLPLLSELIPEVIDGLAETALACWPNWYAESPQRRFERTSSRIRNPADFLAETVPRDARVPVLEPWLRAAIDLCTHDRLPRPAGFSDAVQAAQLALAIDPARFVLLIGTTETEQATERLDGLARAAEWFARTTKAPVAVVVPEALAGNAALDSISFDALRAEESINAWRMPDRPPGMSCDSVKQSASMFSAGQIPQPGRSQLFVWPLHGVPHPRSEGEQKLAQRLRLDDELASLFEFNQLVTTSRDSLHTVDLLWRAGRVIVEIDGYRWHSSREMFARDRHRDYELSISGFLVLRLTHEEVVRDVELAIEKIRDVVHFRRYEPQS